MSSLKLEGSPLLVAQEQASKPEPAWWWTEDKMHGWMDGQVGYRPYPNSLESVLYSVPTSLLFLG